MRQLLGGAEVSVSARHPDEIKRVLLERGLTYAKVARDIGRSRVFISQFCRGDRTASIETARLVFEQLGLDKREADRLFIVDIGRPSNSGRAVSTTDAA